MFKSRILTACILIPLVLVTIFYSPNVYFDLLAAAILLLASWEWSRLSGLLRVEKKVLYIVVQTLIFLIGEGSKLEPLRCLISRTFFSLFPHVQNTGLRYEALTPLIEIFMLHLGVMCWALIGLYLIWARKRVTLPRLLVSFRVILGWVIMTVCWIAIKQLHTVAPVQLLYLLLIVWIADTAAYLGGRLFGRHALAPTLSPNKTWEGMIIGLSTPLVLVFLSEVFFKYSANSLAYGTFIAIFFVALAAVVGDLFESQLKRLEGLKDSGCLLPGHGGILDRVDSLLAAAPVFAVFVSFTGTG